MTEDLIKDIALNIVLSIATMMSVCLLMSAFC